MKHPSEESLLAYLDEQQAGDERAETDRHLAECEVCLGTLARLRQASQILTSGLNVLDLGEPDRWRSGEQWLKESLDRAAAGTRVHDPRIDGAPGDARRVTRLRLVPGGPGKNQARPAPRAQRSFRSLRWAAGIVLVAVAGGSAAVIGIPGLRIFAPAEDREVAVVEAAPSMDAAAVAVRPQDGSVAVVLTNVAEGTRLRIDPVDGGEVMVEVRGDGETRFQARDGLVQADLGGTHAMVRVELPRSVDSTTIMIDDRVVARAVNGEVTPAAAATDDGLVLESGG